MNSLGWRVGPWTLATTGALALACGPARCVGDRLRAEVASLEEDATGSPLNCDETPGAPPSSCISGTLTCGGTVAGTTRGGDSNVSDPFYAGAFCFPSGDRHDGAERVYLLEAPPQMDVQVNLDSPCADLDIAAVAWNYDGRCPTENHPVPECEGSNARGGATLRLNTFQARDYLIFVDGKDGAEGNFRLQVSCTPLVR